MNSIDTPWMTVPEVAAYARSSRSDILAALACEELRGHQRVAGGRWRIHRDDVDAWLRGEPPAPRDTNYTARRRPA